MDYYPTAGAYRNDCPLCNRHNALLATHDMDNEPGYLTHVCRDCGAKFDWVPRLPSDHAMTTNPHWKRK